MSILSGPEIKRQVGLGRILIEPYDERQLNQVSYDVRLGGGIVVVGPSRQVEVNHQYHRADGMPFLMHPNHMREVDCIDPKQQCSCMVAPSEKDGGYVLEPGHLYLGHTMERITTDHYVPTIDGKSSIGRLGVFIHVTAGYGEPGFDGQWTLEIVVTVPTILYPGMRIGQMRFTTIAGEVELYRGNYQGECSRGPVPSRAWKQFQQDALDAEAVRHVDRLTSNLQQLKDARPSTFADDLFPGARAEAEARERAAQVDDLIDDSQRRVLAELTIPPAEDWKPPREVLLVLKNNDQTWRQWLLHHVAEGRLDAEAMAYWDEAIGRHSGPYDPPTEQQEHDIVMEIVKLHTVQPKDPPA